MIVLSARILQYQYASITPNACSAGSLTMERPMSRQSCLYDFLGKFSGSMMVLSARILQYQYASMKPREYGSLDIKVFTSLGMDSLLSSKSSGSTRHQWRYHAS